MKATKIVKMVQVALLLTVIVLFTPTNSNLSDSPQQRGDLQKGSQVRLKIAAIAAGPISVTDDDGFTAAGFSGTGTAENPYVLEDIIILSTGQAGISISNTEAHFKIENVMVSGSTDNGAGGIYLENVKNGTIVNCTVTSSFRGFYLTSAINVTLHGNNASINDDAGFHLTGSINVSLTGNNASGNTQGFFLGNSNSNSLTGNNGSGNTIGFYLSNSVKNTLARNVGSGNGNAGIYILSSDNNSIVDNIAFDNTNGIYMYDSYNNNFSVNRLSGNSFAGIRLYDSAKNVFTGNNASEGNGNGYYLYEASNNSFIENIVKGNANYGFYVYRYSNDNYLEGNTVSGNSNYGFYLNYYSVDNILVDNTVDENTYGFFIVGASDHNCFKSNTVSGNSNSGFYISTSDNILIENTASENYYGFYLLSSNNNTLTGNEAKMNTNHGFYLYLSNNNTLTWNNGSKNVNDGFLLYSSSNNTLESNYGNGNTNGFYLFDSNNNSLVGNTGNGSTNYGLYLHLSNNNSLTGNTINKSSYEGVVITESNNNSLTWNTIHENIGHGIYVFDSGDNLMYLNFLIDNYQGGTSQASDNSHANSWTNGTHGNYWNDYIGTDTGDGTGNLNYTLDGINPDVNAVNDTEPLVYELLSKLTTLQLTGPDDQVFEASSTGSHTITWLPTTNLLPGTYELLVNDNPAGTGSWTNGTAIQVDVDLASLALDVHNYTLVVSDYSNKTVADTVLLTIEDTIAPVIDYSGSTEITIEAGSTGNNLTITATDLHSDTWTVYQDGYAETPVDWISGTPFQVSLDGLDTGGHNITLKVQDTSNNGAILMVNVTVEDNAGPSIYYTGLTEITIEAGSTGNNISASFTDLYPDTYIVYQDGKVVNTSTWTSGGSITVDLDGLDLGIHNITVSALDMSSNEVTLTVNVTVEDTNAPVIEYTGPTEITIEVGATGDNFTADLTDLYPSTYTVYQDGIAVNSSTWISGDSITVDLDGLSLGDHEFTVTVLDTSNNEVTLTVSVTVEDTTAPIIEYTGSTEITFEAGSTGNSISISFTDLYPGTYTVYKDGIAVNSSTWISSDSITVDLDGLPAGNYEFTVTVLDTSNNEATLTVSVTVEDTTAPIIEYTEPAELSYEAGSTGNSLTVTATDLHASTWIIYQDGGAASPENWTSGTPFQVNIDGLDLGTHNITITVLDMSNNEATLTVSVTVEDTTAPIIEYTGSTEITFEAGSTGNSIAVNLTDLYPGTYTVYQDGIAVNSSTWESDDSITVDLDALVAGTYNITINVQDTSNNEASLTVIVTVTGLSSAGVDPMTALVGVILIGGTVGFFYKRRKKRRT